MGVARVLSQVAIAQYRADGYHLPVAVYSRDEAARRRHRLTRRAKARAKRDRRQWSTYADAFHARKNRHPNTPRPYVKRSSRDITGDAP